MFGSSLYDVVYYTHSIIFAWFLFKFFGDCESPNCCTLLSNIVHEYNDILSKLEFMSVTKEDLEIIKLYNSRLDDLLKWLLMHCEQDKS